MTIDTYTKTVLTIIAAALVALVTRDFINPTFAQSGITKVAICSASNPNVCAALFQQGNYPVAIDTHQVPG
jgi:hypothetical protein